MSKLEYDTGKFDDWCIYLTRPKIARYAPLDVQYFTRLRELGAAHTNVKIYNHFVEIFEETTKELSEEVLDKITTISAGYGEDSMEIDILLTTLYAGMIAEQNKAYSMLGKRIKRLGLFQVLMEDMKPLDAANFSRGKKWRELDKICEEKGF